MFVCTATSLSIAVCCALSIALCVPFFFFNDTATTEIYTLSLHDALPISDIANVFSPSGFEQGVETLDNTQNPIDLSPLQTTPRSEEHTSELQSHLNLVCRLLLEKKKKHHPCNPHAHTNHLPPASYPRPAS